jgi:hypothetical protein
MRTFLPHTGSILQRLGSAGVSPRLLGLAQAPVEAGGAGGGAAVCVRGEEYLEGRTLTVRDFRGGAGAGVPPASLARRGPGGCSACSAMKM